MKFHHFHTQDSVNFKLVIKKGTVGVAADDPKNYCWNVITKVKYVSDL
jgi:hypothetical protein